MPSLMKFTRSFIEKSIKNATFVTRLPAQLVTLAKVCEDDASVVDDSELVIGGQELAPAYTEMNDPIEQRNRLEHQAGELQEKIDEEFLTALEHVHAASGRNGGRH